MNIVDIGPVEQLQAFVVQKTQKTGGVRVAVFSRLLTSPLVTQGQITMTQKFWGRRSTSSGCSVSLGRRCARSHKRCRFLK